MSSRNDVVAVRRAMLAAAKPLVTDDEAGFGAMSEAAAELLRDLAMVGERHRPGTLAQMRQAMVDALAEPAVRVQ